VDIFYVRRPQRRVFRREEKVDKVLEGKVRLDADAVGMDSDGKESDANHEILESDANHEILFKI
jgi:hypothetical protein